MSASFETRIRIIVLCVLPHERIGGRFQVNISNMNRVWKEIFEKAHQLVRQVLVKEQLHAAGTVISLRSRSAAKAMHAFKSSRVRSGKSSRISSAVISEARYSSTSYTVIRKPRTQGFPPRLLGSIVM